MTDARPPKRRFIRIYFVDLERDYPDVFFDPTGLSTYVRLLVASEKAWPTLPELPRAMRRADLDKLCAVGLMARHPNQRFELKGYVKERSDRQELARKAVHSRKDRDDAAA